MGYYIFQVIKLFLVLKTAIPDLEANVLVNSITDAAHKKDLILK